MRRPLLTTFIYSWKAFDESRGDVQRLWDESPRRHNFLLQQDWMLSRWGPPQPHWDKFIWNNFKYSFSDFHFFHCSFQHLFFMNFIKCLGKQVLNAKLKKRDPQYVCGREDFLIKV